MGHADRFRWIHAAVAVLTATFWLPDHAFSDGCVLKRPGGYLAEKTQEAFIEWEEGEERLYLSVQTEESDGPTLHIVPIPGPPEEISARPVQRFPWVAYERSAPERAKRELRSFAFWTLLLDSGVGIFIAPCLGTLGRAIDGVAVERSVEELGMVVEVVTAESSEALAAYLADKPFEFEADRIEAIEPYLGGNYSFVCSWVKDPSTAAQARAIRVDFKSPTLYYPMRASNVYDAPIETTVYLKGDFLPDGDATIPGLQCRYVTGPIARLAPGQEPPEPFTRWPSDLPGLEDESVSETGDSKSAPNRRAGRNPPWTRLTKVTINSSPKTWTQDLEFVPGTPLAVTAAENITLIGVGVFIIVGLILAVPLPWLVLPAGEPRLRQVPSALLVGATLCLSGIAAVYAFYHWCKRNNPSFKPPPREKDIPFTYRHLLAVVGILTVILLIVVLVMRHGGEGERVGPWLLLLLGVLALAVLFFALIRRSIALVRAAAGNQAGYFVCFILAHFAVCYFSYLLLGVWISRY
jgi:hypothetical protein